MQLVHKPCQCKSDWQPCKWISMSPNNECMNIKEGINNLRFSIYYEGKGKEWEMSSASKMQIQCELAERSQCCTERPKVINLPMCHFVTFSL